FNVAMMRSRTGWWMISSALTSYPPQPQAREHQRAAADDSHPEKEMLVQPDEADERRGRDRNPGNRVANAGEDAAQHVHQRDEQRNERRDLLSADRRHHEEG